VKTNFPNVGGGRPSGTPQVQDGSGSSAANVLLEPEDELLDDDEELLDEALLEEEEERLDEELLEEDEELLDVEVLLDDELLEDELDETPSATPKTPTPLRAI
jgi:hypothetical protein